ncbi:MAG TPA: DNA topoisomerase IB, partial [Gemmataceae bacterium]|nr:DNA topoisomerase IB [Gemmataceae bacterium]
LGNTKAVCRKCYIHPLVVNAYLDGSLQETLRQGAAQSLTQAQDALPPEESALLCFLQAHLRQEAS